MFTLAQIILLLLAIASWFFPTNYYLAKKTHMSILNCMIICSIYMLILWGVICLFTNLFNSTSEYGFADPGILSFAPLFALCEAVLTGLMVSHIRKGSTKEDDA